MCWCFSSPQYFVEERFKKKIKDRKNTIPKLILKHFINKRHKSSLCHWKVTTKRKLGWKIHTFFWIGSLSHCRLTADQRDQPHIVTTSKKPIREEDMQLIQSGHHRDKHRASDHVLSLCPRDETPLDFFSFCLYFTSLLSFTSSLVREIVRLHSHSCTRVHCDTIFLVNQSLLVWWLPKFKWKQTIQES